MFPARTEDIVVLRTAMAADPTDGRAAQYLGNLLYDRRRYREAIAAWRTAVRLEPSLATAQRNLGIAEYDRLGRPDRAVARYERAMRADPSDARLLFELDQLRKRIGVAPSDRLSALIAREDLVEARDDLSLELVTLLNRLGRHEDALAILTRRRFHPWEGGEGQVTGQWRIANRELGRAALRAGRAAAATDRFMAAAEYPANLGEGKHPLLAENEIHLLIGRAAAAAGDTAARTRWYERAAERQGDTSAPLDVADHWRALALRALGDEEAAMGVLTERHLADKGIVLWGASMGAVSVLRAAEGRSDVRAVLAEAPYDTFRDNIGHHAELFFHMPRWFPLVPLAIKAAEWRAGFDADAVDVPAAARGIRAPILLIVDGIDPRMPEPVVRRIYDAHPGPKKLWVAAGADHTGASPNKDFAKVVGDFLNDSGI